MSFHPFKIFSISLTTIVFVANVALPYAPEANFWKQRQHQITDYELRITKNEKINEKLLLRNTSSVTRNYSDLNPFGTIRKIIKGTSDKIIIHIQDVHMNAEAQKNIAGAIQALIDQDRIDLLALEGAFAPIDLAPLRKDPDQKSVHKVADYLFHQNKIAGPILTAFTSPKTIPPIVGIDDQGHYRANVQAVKESYPFKEKLKAQNYKLKINLNNQKTKVFNKELLDFDAHVQAYRDDQMTLGEFATRLGSRESGKDDVLGELDKFGEAYNLEKFLNFTQVEHERAILLKELLIHLDNKETNELMSMSQAFQLGQINHAELYAYLRHACEKNNVSLTRFPAMRDYLQYILLSDSIVGEKLQDEMRDRENEIYSVLTKTEKERKLIDQSRAAHLQGKLLDFALTKQEWEEYNVILGLTQDPGRKLDSRKQLTRRDLGLRRGDERLAVFEKFYVQAELRDRKMARNLQAAIEKYNAKNVVLVTGGFHSAGIKNYLSVPRTEYPIPTIISFVPKISKIDSHQGSEYLSVFTQEKTPLDKLFVGEKLFLSGLTAVDVPFTQQLVKIVGRNLGYASQQFKSVIVHVAQSPTKIKQIWTSPAQAETTRKMWEFISGKPSGTFPRLESTFTVLWESLRVWPLSIIIFSFFKPDSIALGIVSMIQLMNLSHFLLDHKRRDVSQIVFLLFVSFGVPFIISGFPKASLVSLVVVAITWLLFDSSSIKKRSAPSAFKKVDQVMAHASWIMTNQLELENTSLLRKGLMGLFLIGLASLWGGIITYLDFVPALQFNYLDEILFSVAVFFRVPVVIFGDYFWPVVILALVGVVALLKYKRIAAMISKYFGVLILFIPLIGFYASHSPVQAQTIEERATQMESTTARAQKLIEKPLAQITPSEFKEVLELLGDENVRDNKDLLKKLMDIVEFRYGPAYEGLIKKESWSALETKAAHTLIEGFKKMGDHRGQLLQKKFEDFKAYHPTIQEIDQVVAKYKEKNKSVGKNLRVFYKIPLSKLEDVGHFYLLEYKGRIFYWVGAEHFHPLSVDAVQVMVEILKRDPQNSANAVEYNAGWRPTPAGSEKYPILKFAQDNQVQTLLVGHLLSKRAFDALKSQRKFNNDDLVTAAFFFYFSDFSKKFKDKYPDSQGKRFEQAFQEALQILAADWKEEADGLKTTIQKTLPKWREMNIDDLTAKYNAILDGYLVVSNNLLLNDLLNFSEGNKKPHVFVLTGARHLPDIKNFPDLSKDEVEPNFNALIEHTLGLKPQPPVGEGNNEQKKPVSAKVSDNHQIFWMGVFTKVWVMAIGLGVWGMARQRGKRENAGIETSGTQKDYREPGPRVGDVIPATEKRLTEEELEKLRPLFTRFEDFLANAGGSFENWKAKNPDSIMVVLVRHGESTSNIFRRVQTNTAYSPLSRLGLRQRVAFADQLKLWNLVFDWYGSSSLERANKTMAPAAHEAGKTLHILRRMIEVSIFPIGGIRLDRIKKWHDIFRAAFFQNPEKFNYSKISLPRTIRLLKSLYFTEFQERNIDANGHPMQTFVIGTHGRTIQWSLMVMLRIPFARYENVLEHLGNVSNTSLTVLTYERESNEWKLQVYSDNSYLPADLRIPTKGILAIIFEHIFFFIRAWGKTIGRLIGVPDVPGIIDQYPEWHQLIPLSKRQLQKLITPYVDDISLNQMEKEDNSTIWHRIQTVLGVVFVVALVAFIVVVSFLIFWNVFLMLGFVLGGAQNERMGWLSGISAQSVSSFSAKSPALNVSKNKLLNRMISTRDVSVGLGQERVDVAFQKSLRLQSKKFNFYFLNELSLEQEGILRGTLRKDITTFVLVKAGESFDQVSQSFAGDENVVVLPLSIKNGLVLGHLTLWQLERWMRSSDNVPGHIRLALKNGGSANVFRAEEGPQLVRWGLSKTSLFSHENTLYHVLNQLFEIVRSYEFVPWGTRIRGWVQALKAA